jgi:hypothetical protein
VGRLCFALLPVTVAWLQATAQVFEVPARATVGMGCRALALGNNYVALSDDASAMFFNPAGLGFAPIREFSFSFSGLARTSASEFKSDVTTETDERRTRARLGSVSLLRSFPAKQGGFALALGYYTPYIVDDIVAFDGRYSDGSSQIQVQSDFSAYGQFNLWTGAFGLQIAQNLGIGGSVSFVSGNRKANYTFLRLVDGGLASPSDDYQDRIRQDFRGIEGRFGMLYSIAGRMAVGLRIVPPTVVFFDEDHSYSGYASKGRLEGTYSGAVGFSYVFPFMKATAEMRARSPHPDAREGTDLAYWRGGAGVGAEIPLFVTTFLLRAGYSYNQYDQFPLYVRYRDESDSGEQADSPVDLAYGVHTASAGFAYLAPGGVSFELSYAGWFWKTDTWGTLVERHALHRLLASVSVRY